MPENKQNRARRTYSDEFKKQIVKLYVNGKRRTELVREYDLTANTVDRWIKT